MAPTLNAHARCDARRDAKGRYVPLSEQDTGAWDQEAIGEAEALLRSAGAHWARRDAFSSRRRSNRFTPPAG